MRRSPFSLLSAHALVAVAALVLASFALPSAAQSTGPMTILDDAAGDQTVTAGTLAVQPPAMDQVDIVRLTGDVLGANLTLAVSTTADATATQVTTLAFTVAKGPTSLDGSTASGQAHTITVTGTTAAGVTGATATQSGTTLTVTVPLSAIGAVGGDVLSNITVLTADTDQGSAPDPVTQDNTDATDQAPNAAPGGTFTIPRPAIETGVSLTITGGTLRQVGDCANPPCFTEDRPFTGSSVTTRDGNATVDFTITIRNTGTDADTVNLGLPTLLSTAEARLEKTSVTLLHDTETTVKLNVALKDAPDGTISLTVQGTSTRGAAVSGQATIKVEHPPIVAPPAGRTPVPAALGFLTPMATGLGFDKALGEYAELGLLALLLLLIIGALFLIMTVTRTPWVRIQVTPRKAIVAPGATAEFRVQVASRRKRKLLGRGVLRGDSTTWRAALQLGSSERAPAGKSVDVPLSSAEGGEAPSPASGTVRIHVPHDAISNEKETIALEVVPVDEAGHEHATHRATAKITVEAAPVTGYASARDIQLANVQHDPPNPRPGSTVRTSATVHNAGGLTASLRVVLLLDGKPMLEQRIEVPPRSNADATLPWTAGAGKNQVKVQIFLA